MEHKMEKVTNRKFKQSIIKMAKEIKKLNADSLYGIPRGGSIIAVWLSHQTGLPVVAYKDILKRTIIVDDISDSGKTLLGYQMQGYKIATIYYHKQSLVKPDIWVYEKKKDWILFPWETEKSTSSKLLK